VAEQAQLFARPRRNECVFSPCRRYRYVLQRWVGPGAPPARGHRTSCLWLLANPSIADEYALDPTLTRCAAFTRSFGFDEMRVVNVRAFIATDPANLPLDPTAIGPDNLDHILDQAVHANLLVCGWGRLGGSLAWEVLDEVKRLGAQPHALRLNMDGSPQHPLYLPANLKPFPFGRPHG
jgi:hypothetical protein